jgi:hypothetical protein
MKTILKSLTLLLALLHAQPLIAQHAIKATGEYTMRIEDNMTMNDAKKQAVQYAQLNAIESVLGKIIIQDNSTYLYNKQSGNTNESNSNFNFVSNTYVKGEWVEDLSPPVFKELPRGEERWLSVTVTGKVREVADVQTKFETYALNCPNVKCKTASFNDGQDFYCYFRSPEDGYLAIYLTDPEYRYTFMLLPYKNSAIKKSVPIIADKDYIFFNRQFDYFNEAAAVDEQIISLAPSRSSQKYKLWIVFSPNQLSKPVLEDETMTTRKFLDPVSVKQGYSLQKGMPEEKFREWLEGYRVREKKVQLSVISVDVYK